jgi:hypothetical protein
MIPRKARLEVTSVDHPQVMNLSVSDQQKKPIVYGRTITENKVPKKIRSTTKWQLIQEIESVEGQNTICQSQNGFQ